MYTAKHAMLVREKYPDVNVHVFYIDVRTPGKNFDEFYRRAVEEYNVDYIDVYKRQPLTAIRSGPRRSWIWFSSWIRNTAVMALPTCIWRCGAIFCQRLFYPDWERRLPAFSSWRSAYRAPTRPREPQSTGRMI